MKRLFTAILLAALFILSGCKKEQQIEEPPRTDIDPENAKYDQESLEYTYDWGEHSVPVEQGTADQIKIVNAKCFSLPYTNISDIFSGRYDGADYPSQQCGRHPAVQIRTGRP